MSLAQSAILVELSISSWSGRKLDRKVSSEVNTNKGANRDAVRANKNLFAGSDKLEKVNSYVSATRAEYGDLTLPWSSTGARILPFKEFFNFKEWLVEKETGFTSIVDNFLDEYSSLISTQAFRLGTMFDASEYPTADELRYKFRFHSVFTPMPEAGDFRIDAEGAMKKELEEQYAKAYNERTNAAMQDIWDRLYETVSHLRDKCAMEKTIFRESTMDNAVALCGILTRLNITQDPELEARRRELERALTSVDIFDLRKDAAARLDTKDKMDAILAKMKGVGLC